MEEFAKKDGQEREEIFSKSVRAGKRTYYFDVKSTKKGDYYLTITERKRRYSDDGSYKVEKHKVFLYKEDFGKFADTLGETIEFIENAPEIVTGATEEVKTENIDETKNFTDVKFEDLEN